MHRKIYFPLLLCILCSQLSVGQVLQPKGHFNADSVSVGEPIDYSLSFTYPKGLEVVFPDSSFGYFPFEFERKTFFNTYSDSLVSTDSVVYQLTTFEVDPVQYMALPIFLIIEGDSTQINAEVDSLKLVEVVKIAADTVQVKESMGFENVKREFNYPYLFIAIGLLVLLAAILTFVFGKQIKQRIQLYRLSKDYERFSAAFKEHISIIERDATNATAENALNSWKKYLEKLQSVPYSKLTSKEILKNQTGGRLKEALTGIDRLIYGSKVSDDLSRFYYELEDFATEQYQSKIEQIQNG